MYFVVFIPQIKKHRVVPYKWVRGIDYERIINNGLNKNIKFHTFWTNDGNAFDEHGIPRNEYIPNPNATGTVFPNPGWYLCQIRKFKGIIIFTFLIQCCNILNLHIFNLIVPF